VSERTMNASVTSRRNAPNWNERDSNVGVKAAMRPATPVPYAVCSLQSQRETTS
jgi:hypothetical protein